MNQIVSVCVCASYAAWSIADELKFRNSILGRSFGNGVQRENCHRSRLVRPAPMREPHARPSFHHAGPAVRADLSCLHSAAPSSRAHAVKVGSVAFSSLVDVMPASVQLGLDISNVPLQELRT